MKALLFLFVGCVFMSTCNTKKVDDQSSKSIDISNIKELMASQERAWNAGDIEGFMGAYWDSPDLTFVGKTKVTKGWQQTLENYKKGYPDKEAMGTLSFDIVDTEAVGPGMIHMIGKYTLTYDIPDKTLSGHFTLIWKRIDAEWKIVIDHSS